MSEQLWKVFSVEDVEGNSHHPQPKLLGIVGIPEADWAAMALDLGDGDTGDEAMYRMIEKVFSIPGLTSFLPQVRKFELFSCQTSLTVTEDYLIVDREGEGEVIARISPVETAWMALYLK